MMEVKLDAAREKILIKIQGLIKKNVPSDQIKLVTNFARRFYMYTSLEDLNSKNDVDLFGAMWSHWNFINKHKLGEVNVRLHNPSLEKQGWQSTHTIVEIAHDDMPFLVDSIRMAINRLGLTIHLIIHLGGIKVRRNKKSQIIEILSYEADEKDAISEAPIYIEIDRQTDPKILEEIRETILHVLSDVHVVVEDWSKMRDQISQSFSDIDKAKKHLDPVEVEESKNFLRWIEDNHFTLLGVRDYKLVTEQTEHALEVKPGSGLGVLREDRSTVNKRKFSTLSPEARKLALSKQILIITKTNMLATVHRPVYSDYIGIKMFNNKGQVVGERRIIGLFTSAAYNINPRHIPFLSRKVDSIMKNSRLPPKGHAGKELFNILETLPRDDLFQASVAELTKLAMGILELQERRNIRLFARKDIYGRFISCLVYVPLEYVNTELRMRFQEILEQAFNGTVSTYKTRHSDSVLARLHFVIRIDALKPVQYDVKEIEHRLVEVATPWRDELSDDLIEHYGEEKGNQIAQHYRDAFPAGYRERCTPSSAVRDVELMEGITDKNPLAMSVYRPVHEENGTFHFKLFRRGNTIPLSDVLPIFENMGLRVISESPHEILFKDESSIWINDFGMVHREDVNLKIKEVKDIFQEAFASVWFGNVENDGFNRLVLNAKLTWQEIIIFRAYTKYLRQIGFTFSQSYIEETLSSNTDIARNLIKLFILRFEPDQALKSEVEIIRLNEQLAEQLDAVASLDQDRILRRFNELIQATIRTNYFQEHIKNKKSNYLSFKLNPNEIANIPLPRPMYEIYVYSPRFEAVHLRLAKVARGGIRWSDRREDFRTEILSLMKAQNVKNSVIVPAGAKGGFVPKCLPLEGGREALMDEVIDCYKNFIRGLLDVTDNLKDNKIVRPKDTVCYDKEDPYLVVAADKGTTNFSDIANEIAQEYEFWLGDAFASGGRHGYDHKKMGITARGAWESVKRHFREINIDTQTTAFTVLGVGDMGGDVFGNGMLLSKHIKLVAAFNHQHIFVDPEPNTEKSYKERQRLFKLSRSSWEDYNPKLISRGGGVYKRTVKSIKLSSQVKKLLDVERDFVTPNELIRLLLKSPVDLLWNGGVGTFVKASHETHANAGDRTNDSIRVNANELRCKVIGEGGNLGITQLARVEYCLEGGAIYTDFIDNSGGVNCSDHEVNIKILLNDVLSKGDLTEKQRNQMLTDMTDEVTQSVLRNNYWQTQAISVAGIYANVNAELHNRYIKDLERQGKLDPELEFLPDSEELMERKSAGKGLTRPELAVLFAYSKNIIKEELLDSKLPEDPYFSIVLELGFPELLYKKYLKVMQNHSLRREIIATQLSNSIVNEMGLVFVYRLHDETGAPTSSIVRAYTIARKIFSLGALWESIEQLDYRVSSEIQADMMRQLMRLIRRSSRWILRNRRVDMDVASSIEQFSDGISTLRKYLPELLVGQDRQSYDKMLEKLLEAKVPDELAKDMASTQAMFSALDIIDAATANGHSIEEVARVYFALGDKLGLGWFRDQITNRPVETHWDALVREALRDDVDWQQRGLSIGVLVHKTRRKDLDGRIQSWMKKYEQLIDRWHGMLTEIRGTTTITYTMLSVAVRELLDLTQTSYHGSRNGVVVEQSKGSTKKKSNKLPKVS